VRIQEALEKNRKELLKTYDHNVDHRLTEVTRLIDEAFHNGVRWWANGKI